MATLKIAVIPGCLHTQDPYEAFEKIASMGVTGIHLGVAQGTPFHPDRMDSSARRKLLSDIRGMGLEVSAVSSWGGSVDLGDRENIRKNQALEEARQFLELSADLDCRIWQAHVGIIPGETTDPRWSIYLDAVGEVARLGEATGTCLAVETGPETPDIVLRLMQAVDSPGLRVNYDPANLAMWPGILAQRGKAPRLSREQIMASYKPTDGVTVLAPYIVHTHAKDGLTLCEETDPAKNWWQEVPLGQGWVDWPTYVRLLTEAGYDGYFAIEREVGKDPEGDIRRAVHFLRSLES